MQMTRQSIWTKESQEPQKIGEQTGQRSCLAGELKRKVLIIGAGMTGVLTGYFLQQQGVEAAILEAGSPGSGQTGRTTAKITSQHGLTYHYLASKLGPWAAREYAEKCQQAICDYEQIIKKENISCSFQKVPAYLYTRSREEALQQEWYAARQAGISCAMQKETELPFDTTAALRFDGQAQFHPIKFLEAISSQLEIYENTPVLKVRGNTLVTPKGTAQGEVIVFACHFPIVNRPGYYFTRMHQERSYVLALEKAQSLEGMYYGIDPDWGWSFRSAEGMLIMGGGSRRSGSIPKKSLYDLLSSKAQELWPGCKTAAAWSAQDCMPADRIPFIGRFSHAVPNWYVASGFKKWGMTCAMISARLLSSMIFDPCVKGSKLFDPSYHSLLRSLPQILRDGAISTRNLAAALIGLGPKCPHLGCRLHWNPFETTWECQCHGSRFDENGNMLDEPAQEGARL